MTSCALTEKYTRSPGASRKFGRGLCGDVGGKARRAVGLLVGAHANRGSAAVQLGDHDLDGVARAAVRLVAVDRNGRRGEDRDGGSADHDVGRGGAVPGATPLGQ